MSKNTLLRVLDEADTVSESLHNFMMKSENEDNISSLHQTTESLRHQANSGGSYSYDRPLRPLSAYNLYFQLQRERILKYGINNKEYETIPFTIQDIERVVRERYQNWAGIAPTEATDFSSKKKNKNDNMPSFGELSSQIGSSWKKIDKETKKLFESFANDQRMENNKIYGTTNNQIVSIRQSIPVTSPTLQKIPRSSLNEVSPKVARSMTSHFVSPNPNVAINTKSQMINIHSMNQIDVSDKLDDASSYGRSDHLDTLCKNHKTGVSFDVASHNCDLGNMQPNLIMSMTMSQQITQMDILQRNVNMAQHRFRMWQQYQAVMQQQYDTMMTSVMNDFQMFEQVMTHEQHNDNDYNTLIDTFHEQDDRNNNFYHHVVSSSSLLPNDWDDITYFGNESLTHDSFNINCDNQMILPDVSHNFSFQPEDDNDELFHTKIWDF